VVHRNGRLFENGNVIGHSTTHLDDGFTNRGQAAVHLKLGAREHFRRPGRTSLLSNVVTLLVIVPPEVDVCCHNVSLRTLVPETETDVSSRNR
jgi:hypothetical protein